MNPIPVEKMGGVFPLESQLAEAEKQRRRIMPINFGIGAVVENKYKILELIGRGGMGVVLKVERVDTKKKYALKYCTENDDESLKRFKREVRIMKGIHHKHVIRIIDANLDCHPPYFVMPLAKNSIDDEIKILKDNENKALEVFEQMCLGVGAIHASNCFHRDIKPINALRLPDETVVVCDLGLAKLDPRDSTTITQTHAFIGTRIYCAPEQLLPAGSRDADGRTDIFQLGKTLYEILTGRSPALIDVGALAPGLGHIIQRATKDRPEDRYQTLGNLMDAIETYRLSKDPALHPRQYFENLVERAKELLKRGEYNRNDLRKMLEILSDGIPLSSENVVDLFATIPPPLLPIMAENLADELASALQKYAAAIKESVGSHSFEYAELVANRMKRIFNATDKPELRTFALLATLFAGVSLWRFAAQDVFNEMIVSLKPEDVVLATEALRENADYYKKLADRVPRDNLNPAIRKLRDELVGEPKKTSEE